MEATLLLSFPSFTRMCFLYDLRIVGLWIFSIAVLTTFNDNYILMLIISFPPTFAHESFQLWEIDNLYKVPKIYIPG